MLYLGMREVCFNSCLLSNYRPTERNWNKVWAVGATMALRVEQKFSDFERQWIITCCISSWLYDDMRQTWDDFENPVNLIRCLYFPFLPKGKKRRARVPPSVYQQRILKKLGVNITQLKPVIQIQFHASMAISGVGQRLAFYFVMKKSKKR
jgi:hypothetical protein